MSTLTDDFGNIVDSLADLADVPVASPQHSPLPWTAHDDDGTGTLPCVLSDKVNQFGNFYAAQCNQYADARFIAKACNNYEKMISFVEFVRKFYQDNFDVMPVAFQTVDSEAESLLAEVQDGD